jgi:hypothetical protein
MGTNFKIKTIFKSEHNFKLEQNFKFLAEVQNSDHFKILEFYFLWKSEHFLILQEKEIENKKIESKNKKIE